MVNVFLCVFTLSFPLKWYTNYYKWKGTLSCITQACLSFIYFFRLDVGFKEAVKLSIQPALGFYIFQMDFEIFWAHNIIIGILASQRGTTVVRRQFTLHAGYTWFILTFTRIHHKLPFSHYMTVQKWHYVAKPDTWRMLITSTLAFYSFWWCIEMRTDSLYIKDISSFLSYVISETDVECAIDRVRFERLSSLRQVLG